MKNEFEILPNGATLISSATIGDTEVILAKTERDYVTWLARAGDRESTYWGHYFGKAFPEAQKDYNQRIADRVHVQ